MDADLKMLLAIIGVIAAIVLLYGFLAIIVLRRRAQEKNDRRAQILNRYSRESVYLCYQAKDVGAGQVQFDGEPHGTAILPGVTTVEWSGKTYIVKEVYNSDRTNDPNLDQPEAELKNGESNTAIVVEVPAFNFSKFQQLLKEDDGYMILKVK